MADGLAINVDVGGLRACLVSLPLILNKHVDRTYTRIFPVNVDAVKPLVHEKLGDIGCKNIRVVDDSRAEDVKSCSLS